MLNFLLKFGEKPEKLFGFLFWNFLLGYLPFGFLFCILSLVGVLPVNFNGDPKLGVVGFILMLVYIPFFAIIMTILSWFFLSIGSALIKLISKNRK